MTPLELISVCATVAITVISIAVVMVNSGGKKEAYDRLNSRVERLELQREEFIRLETKVDSIHNSVADMRIELKEFGKKAHL